MDHVQQPLIVDYQDEWRGEVTLQELMNCWANEGMAQSTRQISSSKIPNSKADLLLTMADHLTGHYYTILVYRDLMWLADDGQVTRALPPPEIPKAQISSHRFMKRARQGCRRLIVDTGSLSKPTSKPLPAHAVRGKQALEYLLIPIPTMQGHTKASSSF